MELPGRLAQRRLLLFPLHFLPRLELHWLPVHPVVKRTLEVVAVSILLGMVVVLSISNYVLRQRLNAAYASANGAASDPPSSFHVGDVIPAFAATDRDGRKILVRPSERPRILILTLPGCEACEHVLEGVATKPNQNVLVVSVLPKLASTADAEKVPKAIPMVFIDDFRKSPIRNRARVIPQILRITDSGKVTEVCKSYEACIEKPLT